MSSGIFLFYSYYISPRTTDLPIQKPMEVKSLGPPTASPKLATKELRLTHMRT